MKECPIDVWSLEPHVALDYEAYAHFNHDLFDSSTHREHRNTFTHNKVGYEVFFSPQ